MSGIQRFTGAALAAAVALTASANAQAVDISKFGGLAAITLNSSATGGAGQTYNAKLQHSEDGVSGWTDITGGAFDQVTNAGPSFQRLLLNLDQLKKFVRVVDTLAGTSPTVVRAVGLTGKIAV